MLRKTFATLAGIAAAGLIAAPAASAGPVVDRIDNTLNAVDAAVPDLQNPFPGPIWGSPFPGGEHPYATGYNISSPYEVVPGVGPGGGAKLKNHGYKTGCNNC